MSISERTHVRVEKGTARVNFWPLLVGRISVRDARADLVLIEVKPRLQSAAEDAAEIPAAPAEHQRGDALRRTAWSSSRPTAGASSSTTSAAPASSATRPSASSKATSSIGVSARARHRRAARRRPDEAQRRNHHAHDHRRPARLARRCELRRRSRQTTADGASCRSRSARTCVASC